MSLIQVFWANHTLSQISVGDEVAQAGGQNLNEVIAFNDEGKAIEVMAEGASQICKRLFSEGNLDGILAIGGSMGSSVGLAAMRGLPLGIPKLLITAAGFAFIRPELTSNDLTIMATIADLWGTGNRIVRGVLNNASVTITGMVEQYSRKEDFSGKIMVGLTTLGTAGLKYAPLLRPLLEENGYELVVFIPAMAGTESLKNLIEEGQIHCVFDLCLIEFANSVCNPKACWTGINRIKIAGKKGIPLVISPGAIDFFLWLGLKEELPPKYKDRQIHAHNPLVYLINTIPEEKIEVAKKVAQDLNSSKGQVSVIFPTQGFSEFDKEGGIFYDPDGRKAFIETLKKYLKSGIRVIELDTHINDELFARKAVELMDMMREEKS